MAGTLKTRFNLYIAAFFVYWYAPVGYGFLLWRNLKMGAFSADNDAIAIPLFAFIFLWFVGFPFFLVAALAFEMLMRKLDRRKRLRLGFPQGDWEQTAVSGVK